MSISKHYHDFNRCNFAYALCISTFDNDSFQHFESTKSAKREDFYFIDVYNFNRKSYISKLHEKINKVSDISFLISH